MRTVKAQYKCKLQHQHWTAGCNVDCAIYSTVNATQSTAHALCNLQYNSWSRMQSWAQCNYGSFLQQVQSWDPGSNGAGVLHQISNIYFAQSRSIHISTNWWEDFIRPDRSSLYYYALSNIQQVGTFFKFLLSPLMQCHESPCQWVSIQFTLENGLESTL